MNAVDVIAAFIYQMKSKVDTNLKQEWSVEMLTLVVPAILKDKEKRLIKKATETVSFTSLLFFISFIKGNIDQQQHTKIL